MAEKADWEEDVPEERAAQEEAAQGFVLWMRLLKTKAISTISAGIWNCWPPLAGLKLEKDQVFEKSK